jgi:hypothetical protein
MGDGKAGSWGAGAGGARRLGGRGGGGDGARSGGAAGCAGAPLQRGGAPLVDPVSDHTPPPASPRRSEIDAVLVLLLKRRLDTGVGLGEVGPRGVSGGEP